MKRILFLLTLFIGVVASAQTVEKYIPAKPNPQRLVNDYTNTLTKSEVDQLERQLVAYDDSTSNQFAVVILPTTGEAPIEDVALGILRKWGVGNASTNNGLVLLIAKEDRKIRIEVAYGLEGAITDGLAGSIIDTDITPAFRKGNYYHGIHQAIESLQKAAQGEYRAPAGYNHRKKKGVPTGAIVIGTIALLILFSAFGGGGGGGYVSRRGYRGWWFPTAGGWTGGSSGGGGWSGGGGGGGFGGFGGGSGGGGGASGSW